MEREDRFRERDHANDYKIPLATSPATLLSRALLDSKDTLTVPKNIHISNLVLRTPSRDLSGKDTEGM